MPKLPFMKFFVNDWLADEKVSLCSLAARGLWLHMLCLMHKGGRRGYLDQEDGQALSLEKLARSAGVSTDEASRLIQELTDSGVASVTDSGVIYNRRMVREETISKVRSAAGKKGGHPLLLKQNQSKHLSKPLASDLNISSSGKEEKTLYARHGMGVQGEGDLLKQNQSKFACECQKDDCIDTVASWLAVEWDKHNQKTVNGRKTETVEDAIPVMLFLLNAGISQDVILAEIRSKRRDKTEWLGDFKKRLLAGNRSTMSHSGVKEWLARGEHGSL